MTSGFVQRQRIDPQNRLHVEFAIEMRKQRAAARRLPFQLVAERVGVDRDQHQVALPGKPFRRGFGSLLGGGEMDEAVLMVSRRAAIAAFAFGFAPFGSGADFVDRVHAADYVMVRHRRASGAGGSE